ncbi:MAG: hypothetical protein WA994_11665 [Ornithinimicrobium sp.]
MSEVLAAVDGRVLAFVCLSLVVVVMMMGFALMDANEKLDRDVDQVLGDAGETLTSGTVPRATWHSAPDEMPVTTWRLEGSTDPVAEQAAWARAVEDAEIEPELLVLEAEVVELLRTTQCVDPPLHVWDRIEEAINRPPAGSLQEEWSRVTTAVEQGRADFRADA